MAVGFPAGITEAYVINNAQSRLAALRRALLDCAQFEAWLAGLAVTDLEAAPVSMDVTSAQAIFNAMADANGMYQLYSTGTDTRNPGAGYVYGASQRVVIGPLS